MTTSKRVLAHAHTDWSHDGRLTLAEWVAIARALPCDVVLFTEHEESGWTSERYERYVRACDEASTDRVELIPGIEFLQEGCHVLGYGLRTLPPRPSTAGELARAVAEQGSFLCLAHPAKYRWRIPASLVGAAIGVEVWNSKWIYDGTLGPHPRSLRLGRDKRLLAGQDVHARHHVTSVFLHTDTPDVLADLRDGHYVIVQDDVRWRPDDLRQWRARPALQRLRHPVLRSALTLSRRLGVSKLRARVSAYRRTRLT